MNENRDRIDLSTLPGRRDEKGNIVIRQRSSTTTAPTLTAINTQALRRAIPIGLRRAVGLLLRQRHGRVASRASVL